ncbi:hypothetical protein [Brevibacillus fulvus]|uniref:Uncharacterized protein n=1 Tax=Brevibacillus fulvus TaxID=1125967 RepID=A0A938XVC7_9BACL|nr:hypothetical protein [Brevibacillus fulvus]MBM7590812.1 hypothetical protein [Brevibacillus fulvus]
MDRTLKKLRRHYRNNPGFKQWVKANEAWFRQNPDTFRQLVRDPAMVNLFLDLLVVNSPEIDRKLRRSRRP